MRRLPPFFALRALEAAARHRSYSRAADSERGEWAFREGVSTALAAEPQICKYEALHERPGPFYIEPDWTEEARAAKR